MIKTIFKLIISIPILALVTGCATLTEDAMTPIAISFSDGSSGKSTLTNKRGVWGDGNSKYCVSSKIR